MESDRYKPAKATDSGENHHYSPEEMMARLKKNHRQKNQSDSRDDGELVTREDGTQVVKVRRRKRRSKQPEKKKKGLNSKVKWAILGSVISFGILMLAGTVIIIAKYNSASFKKKTEAMISDLSGATQTEVSQMRVTPISAKAIKAELEWDQHSFLKSAVFHHLEADILATSFIGSSWIGEEIVSSQADVFLQTPASSAETANDPVESPYNFGSYRCNQLNLHFGSNKGAPIIAGMRVSLRTLADDRSQIVFNSGRMIMKGWPELDISSGIATLNTTDMEIEALLEAGEAHKGVINIKGRIRKNTGTPVVLDVKAKDYPIQELLGKGLGRLVMGEISSEMGALKYDHNESPRKALSFVMPFNSSDIRMTELPMFTELKDLTRDTQYVRPTFNDCSGTLIRTSEGVIIDNIDFKSFSVISLSGRISVKTDGNLSGSLTVGLPRRLFDKNNVPAGFSGPHNGIYSAKVKISGTIHNPYDNLSELLKTGKAGNRALPAPAQLTPPQPTAPSGATDKEKEFEELLR